jgi:hypothetical protein
MATKPLRLIVPVEVTPTKLVSSTLAETDETEWVSGTTYALNARVQVTSNHKIYQSLQAGNLGKSPSLAENIGVWWQEVSPTNRYKMFDTSNSTTSVASGTMTFVIQPGRTINGIALLGMKGVSSARVIMTSSVEGVVFDQTYDLRELIHEASWYSYFYDVASLVSDFTVLDLPAYGNSTITVTLTGSGTIALGTFIMGSQMSIGLGAEYGARVGIQDYSRAEYNDYGDLILVRRNYSQRASFEMTLTKAETDYVNRIITSLRATPVLWIGTDEYESTLLFGIFKEFEITYTFPLHNKCSLQLYGLARL